MHLLGPKLLSFAGCNQVYPLGAASVKLFSVFLSSTENECTDYHILNSSDRSMTHYNPSAPKKCDHWVQTPSFKNKKRWYRFTGKAGQAMSEKCVPPHKCQTLRSGWMKGKHPEVGFQSQTAAEYLLKYFFVCII